MYTVDSTIYAEARLTERQFRSLVGSICGRRISRSWFYELRGEMGISSGSYTAKGARAVAYYAQLRKRRIDPDQAKQMTIQFVEENNL
jgi:hypothetical protein